MPHKKIMTQTLQPGNETMWRCDNGECIEDRLRRDGKATCKDRSDERMLEVQWGSIILATVVIVLVGILASYGCRLLNIKNVRNCFHCSLCSSDRKSKVGLPLLSVCTSCSSRNTARTLATFTWRFGSVWQRLLLGDV
jgi:hypothetical protein